MTFEIRVKREGGESHMDTWRKSILEGGPDSGMCMHLEKATSGPVFVEGSNMRGRGKGGWKGEGWVCDVSSS